MLTQLHIENVAVIRRADITFGPGLNVLTGETGAGKSIVIDALSAVLGGRTSRELVRQGADHAVVTACFTGETAREWLEENDIDPEDELLLMRRITADGKSACRINGLPCTAAQLRALGGLLLDIHGQNDGRQLMDESRHRGYLDAFGVPAETLSAWQSAWRTYDDLRRELERQTMDEFEKARRQQRLSACIEELEDARLRPGEEAELTARRDLLRNAERLTEAARGAYECLYAGDGAALEQVEAAEGLLSRAAGYSEELAGTAKEVAEARFALEDAAERLRDFCDSLDFSPEEYDRMETRLAQLHRLEKKYGGGEEDLLALLEDSRKQLTDLDCAEERAHELEADLAKAEKAARRAAGALTEARTAAAERLDALVEAQLHDLSMPSARFVTRIGPKSGTPGFDSTGADEVRFLLAANAGTQPETMARIASGGELSRIMLALKSVFAQRDAVPSLVFDEIDTGVSGVAAQRVGEKLAGLSRHKQILCVTHLPQIAAMADEHLEIRKTEQDGQTSTDVRRLDHEGRLHELARLHGGENVTATTLESAGEQLEAAARYKSGFGG